MKRMITKVTAWVLPVILTSSALALDVGDRAPGLTIAEWVQGKPVNLKKEIGSKVFMVEFWATWCPPCKASVPRLSRLQNKYKNDLTIIGVTAADNRGNTASAVKRFVKTQGPDMSYTVAMDKDMETSTEYMGGAGIMGIPYAFLVMKDGRIAWHGSPLEPGLDDVIAQMVGGEYDIEAAKITAQVDQRFQALNPLVQMGHWSAVWDGLIGILKLDPANETALQLILAIHRDQIKDARTFRAWASSHIVAFRNHVEGMKRLAATLCDNPDLSTRLPDLALEAAKAAYDASKRRDASVLAVYARTLYQVGELDRAIELQTDAVAIANAEERKAAQAILDYYILCKQLQGT